MSTALCPSDWIIGPDKNKCFGFIRNPQSWDVSEAYCKSLGGNLAALTSFQELTVVQNLCGEINNGCWVGGRGINSTFDAGWKWSDNTSHWNESLFPGISLHSNCTNSSCHIANSGYSCTLVKNGSTSLIGERCNVSHASICMTDMGMHLTYISVICSSPSQLYMTSCYHVIYYSLFSPYKLSNCCSCSYFTLLIL